MAKFEKEIKVLDIDVHNMEKKLKDIGATFKGEKFQKIFTYDVPSIYHRYLEIKELLKASNELLYNTNLIKLKTLLLEVEDLTSDKILKNIYQKYNINNLKEIVLCSKDEVLKFLNDETLENILKKLFINPNKWVRLRESNNKVELTTKHVFDKSQNNIQSVLETEIEVSSLEETNLLLESIGLARRNYQEKIRKSYIYEDAEIEIDIWPKLKPYMEIECHNSETIEKLVNSLELKDKKIVSCNTSALYKETGIDIQNISELKFDN